MVKAGTSARLLHLGEVGAQNFVPLKTIKPMVDTNSKQC